MTRSPDAGDQLINLAVADKVSALRTEEYFRERGRRANRAETLRILNKAGKGNPPFGRRRTPYGTAERTWQEDSAS